MRVRSAFISVSILALLLASGTGQAGTDLNEVGAFLVYPVVIAFGDDEKEGGAAEGAGSAIETYLSVVHTGDTEVSAHVAFINGNEEDLDYCFECNYNLPLTPNDAELIVVHHTPFGFQIDTEDGTLQGACPHRYGMVTINLENPIGTVLTDNTLLGSSVYVDYSGGIAFSLPAIPFQGQNGGDGDRSFEFDGVEYGAFPRVVAADFIAPSIAGGSFLGAALALFTLGFEAEFPPFTHCEIEGFDAAENPFSRSFNFGCWTIRDLLELHPEFFYGNLGQQACTYLVDCDTHGWFKLDCDVTEDGGIEVEGGVHGAIIQVGSTGAVVCANDPNAPGLASNAAWARLLYQSVTVGGDVTYRVAGPGGGLN